MSFLHLTPHIPLIPLLIQNTTSSVGKSAVLKAQEPHGCNPAVVTLTNSRNHTYIISLLQQLTQDQYYVLKSFVHFLHFLYHLIRLC